MDDKQAAQPQEFKQPRQIVIDERGNLRIVGVWKVRELLAAAQMIAEAANGADLTFEAR